jgi:hypothetical protein
MNSTNATVFDTEIPCGEGRGFTLESEDLDPCGEGRGRQEHRGPCLFVIFFILPF